MTDTRIVSAYVDAAGDLMRYRDAFRLRKATTAERKASEYAATRDGGPGVISVEVPAKKG